MSRNNISSICEGRFYSLSQYSCLLLRITVAFGEILLLTRAWSRRGHRQAGPGECRDRHRQLTTGQEGKASGRGTGDRAVGRAKSAGYENRESVDRGRGWCLGTRRKPSVCSGSSGDEQRRVVGLRQRRRSWIGRLSGRKGQSGVSRSRERWLGIGDRGRRE